MSGSYYGDESPDGKSDADRMAQAREGRIAAENEAVTVDVDEVGAESASQSVVNPLSIPEVGDRVQVIGAGVDGVLAEGGVVLDEGTPLPPVAQPFLSATPYSEDQAQAVTTFDRLLVEARETGDSSASSELHAQIAQDVTALSDQTGVSPQTIANAPIDEVQTFLNVAVGGNDMVSLFSVPLAESVLGDAETVRGEVSLTRLTDVDAGDALPAVDDLLLGERWRAHVQLETAMRAAGILDFRRSPHNIPILASEGVDEGLQAISVVGLGSAGPSVFEVIIGGTSPVLLPLVESEPDMTLRQAVAVQQGASVYLNNFRYNENQDQLPIDTLDEYANLLSREVTPGLMAPAALTLAALGIRPGATVEEIRQLTAQMLSYSGLSPQEIGAIQNDIKPTPTAPDIGFDGATVRPDR